MLYDALRIGNGTASECAEWVGLVLFMRVAKARFVHDCSACVFLGTDGFFDVYACQGSWLTGLVWRYGDGVREYTTLEPQLPYLVRELSRAADPKRSNH